MKFNEFTIRQTFETKSFKLTKENIMEFAEKYDPQYMHFDEEKTKQGRFNGIIASVINTLGISYKHVIDLGIYVDDMIDRSGMKNIKFIKRVYTSHELLTIVEVIYKRLVKRDAGNITVSLSTDNEKGEKVFRGDLSALI